MALKSTVDDVLMPDGDIVTSTKQSLHLNLQTEAAQPTPVVLNGFFKQKSVENARPRPQATLRGSSLKREVIFDHDLTELHDAPRPPKYKELPYATAQTGLVYDVRMRFHVEQEASDVNVHPEDPRRIHAIYESFVEAGLAWGGLHLPTNDYYMGRIDVRSVTKEEVRLVHTEEHWNWVQSLSQQSPEWFLEEGPHQRQHPDSENDSVYLSPMTPYCAALSAGGAIEACRAVMLGKVKNVFAIIRPPGHHAEREDIKGFCFYDNVSIATKVCQGEFGENCRKVLILDWDVHHGNGIQQATYDDPNVVYISLHVHKRGRFYPEISYRDKRGPYGDHLHCGGATALGKNVNIPWTQAGMGDADYVYAFQQIVMPIAVEFNPDLVIIAAGFDAAMGDELGGCRVTPAGYAHMTHMLMSLAQGRVAVCLEGGYNLESISSSATAVARTLMGEPPGRLADMTPTVSAVDDIKLVLRTQSRFWSALYPEHCEWLKSPVEGQRLHDIVRRWQASVLWDEFEMSPLFIYREQLSKSFENQVLATPTYTEARPLLLILHDPPEVLAEPDPRTGKVELHNTWLTDVVKTYVDWAVKHDFAVIDVNLPKHVTDIDDGAIGKDKQDFIGSKIAEATDLLTYVWDNYIELNDATQVFIVGTNTGHGAIVNFVKANEERAQERLTMAISFIEDVPLQSVRSSTDEGLTRWYYEHSLVFMSPGHAYWNSEVSQKPRRKFGKIVQSSEGSISGMLTEHQDALVEALLTATADFKLQAPGGEIDAMDTSLGNDNVLANPKRMPPISNSALLEKPTQVISQLDLTSSSILKPAGDT